MPGMPGNSGGTRRLLAKLAIAAADDVGGMVGGGGPVGAGDDELETGGISTSSMASGLSSISLGPLMPALSPCLAISSL